MLRFLKSQLHLFLILSLCNTIAGAKNSSQKLVESISITLKISGDLDGQYSLSGPLNSTIESESDSPNSKCSTQVLFRKVKVKEIISIEAWMSLKCTFEGQKKEFKFRRIYLDPAQSTQKIQIRYLDKKIQKLDLEFQDLSVQKGK